MNAKLLIAGAAIAALSCVSAQAASTHSAGAYAEPSQPIAYSSLKTYMKTPASQRAKRDWSGGAAASAGNAGANVSATTPENAGSTAMPAQAPAAMPTPGGNVSDTPPTVSPRVDAAPAQPPLSQDSGMTAAQPPASNAPATTDQPAPAAPQ